MVQLPDTVFYNSLEFGKIYKFWSKKLIKTTKPHYHVILFCDNDEVFILCITSQFDKIKKFIEYRQYNESTLICIKSDNENKLPKDSYINCNSPQIFTKTEFIKLYNESMFEMIGEINDNYKEQIIIGINDSSLVEKHIKKQISLRA